MHMVRKCSSCLAQFMVPHAACYPAGLKQTWSCQFQQQVFQSAHRQYFDFVFPQFGISWQRASIGRILVQRGGISGGTLFTGCSASPSKADLLLRECTTSRYKFEHCSFMWFARRCSWPKVRTFIICLASKELWLSTTRNFHPDQLGEYVIRKNCVEHNEGKIQMYVCEVSSLLPWVIKHLLAPIWWQKWSFDWECCQGLHSPNTEEIMPCKCAETWPNCRRYIASRRAIRCTTCHFSWLALMDHADHAD